MIASVALVGAGPGDPELVTLRAESLLGDAAAVVVDAGLVHLACAFGPRAEVLAVPEGRAAAATLLGAVARADGPVVRLYLGDPWLHPAFETERVALARAGVAAEAVAGVAVEVAAPALAGVPLHVRHLAVACTIGPYGLLPAATEPAWTLVASGADPAAMARSVATGGDDLLPAAVVPLTAPASAWRGSLRSASFQTMTMTGPFLLVVGAVCEPGSRSAAALPAADDPGEGCPPSGSDAHAFSASSTFADPGVAGG